MKKISVFSVKAVLVLFLAIALLAGCKKKDVASGDALDKDTSYAFGMYMANIMGGQMGLYDVRFDYNAFMEGFKAFLEAKETRLTPEQAMEKISAAVNQMQARSNELMAAEGEKHKAEGEAYLAENGRKSGVITTSSGLQYEVLLQGTGEKPGVSDEVRVHYEGSLIDGTVFDSSYQSGSPIEFNLSYVIPGWTEGVQLMNEGSTFRFVIPSDLAYGPSGAGPIPPNSTLVFQVELISVLK